MTVTDPADARLLAALAEVGKAAVHEVAAKVGMDPREVAYRLVGLSASGLPLLVGVESDPNGLRSALANAPLPPAQPQQAPQGPPGGSYPPSVPSGQHPAQAPPSGGYPMQPPPPSRPADPPRPVPPQQQPPPQRSAPRQQAPPQQLDPVLSTWGPPQSAMWARNDQDPGGGHPVAGSSGGAQQGRVGDVLESQGLEGESLAIQLLEVQDPADFLFGAGGYQLAENERAVVVHTEFTNRGRVPFASLPDNYLELLTADGRPITKDPMSLTSRPPHKIGLAPGETASGHAIYVLPSDMRIVAVRWSPRPEPDTRTRTWTIDE